MTAQADRDQPSRICVFTTAHPRDDVRVYSKFVRSWLDQGHSVTWVGPDLAAFSTPQELDPRVEFIPLRRSSGVKGRIGGLAAARTVLDRSGSYDWVYCPDPDAAAIAVTLSGLRVIFDIHEDFDRNPRIEALPTPLRAIARKTLVGMLRAVCKRSSIVSSVNEPILRKFAGSHDATIIVHNAPPKEFAAAHRSSAPSTPLRFFHGKASPTNGTPVIMSAFSLLDDASRPRLILFPWSNAEQNSLFDPQIFDTVKALGLEDSVVYNPPVPHQRMAQVMGSADVGLVGYGRLLGEASLPNRFFEYMSLGLPVVVPTYSPLMVDIVERHGAGLTADFEDPASVRDAVLWLQAHPTEMAEMSQNSLRAYTDVFSWNAAFARLTALMKRA